MCLFPKCLPSARACTSSRARRWSMDGVNDCAPLRRLALIPGVHHLTRLCNVRKVSFDPWVVTIGRLGRGVGGRAAATATYSKAELVAGTCKAMDFRRSLSPRMIVKTYTQLN